MSVHLVGTGYGLVPEGSGQKSVVVLQNELAANRCKDGAFAVAPDGSWIAVAKRLGCRRIRRRPLPGRPKAVAMARAR